MRPLRRAAALDVGGRPCVAAACAEPAAPSTTRTRSPSPRKPPPVATTCAFGIEPAGDLDAIADAPADRDLGLQHLRVGADAQDVAEAVAQQHRALRQRQRLAACRARTRRARTCRPRGAAARQVDVDHAVARLRVDRRRDHAHLAFDRRCRRRRRRVAVMPGLDARRSAAVTSARHSRRPWRIRRNSSCPAGTHRADGGAARRDDAVVGRQHLGLRQAQLLRLRGARAAPRAAPARCARRSGTG